MRVLFTTWAWRSHLYALVPLAWACRAAGHDVLVASQRGLVDEIVATGLPAVAVGQDVDAAGMVRGYLLPRSGPPAKGPRALQMLLAHAESMTSGLIDVAKQWRADVIVFEPTALAGPIAAAAVGIPAVRQTYGPDLLSRAKAVLPDALAPLAEKYRAGAFDPFGVVTIDPTPAPLRLPADYPRFSMRYIPFNGPGAVPAQLPKTRTRVCVTWGHTIASVDPTRFLLPSVVAAISELGVEVIAAVSADQRQLLGPVPPDVHMLVDAPLHHLLPGCDLVIAHGGAGSTLTTLHHGIPLLLVPQLPDHIGHSAQVLASGAGEVLTVDELSPDRLRSEVVRLSDCDGPHRAAAVRIQQEMQASPPPAALVPELLLGAGVPG
ncbi:UDP:flavonoid glycosyltransferase YjiC (YdhE family) [Kibdelosporangium banguiense]|uniref:UDP:flavonoid glycosyltransferase YjiC (YdhE family) n=1 Tax=Kibdelosporangium banguiense TaxID=1365924 RepID=A0ABS4TTD1_9PSEU|nr:nucleotide disphospho-sugar-binding domain-containing protein [Kibdelosporangium banguiense]MBP2327264.1 UDP:flavonoid glycosyltransferase YjiC (YdhE family) [Kibdelosporangium banguiense]